MSLVGQGGRGEYLSPPHPHSGPCWVDEAASLGWGASALLSARFGRRCLLEVPSQTHPEVMFHLYTPWPVGLTHGLALRRRHGVPSHGRLAVTTVVSFCPIHSRPPVSHPSAFCLCARDCSRYLVRVEATASVRV